MAVKPHVSSAIKWSLVQGVPCLSSKTKRVTHPRGWILFLDIELQRSKLKAIQPLILRQKTNSKISNGKLKKINCCSSFTDVVWSTIWQCLFCLQQTCCVTFVSCLRGVESARSGLSATSVWESTCSPFSSSAFLSGVTVVMMFPLTRATPSAELSVIRVSWFSIIGAGRWKHRDECDSLHTVCLYIYTTNVSSGIKTCFHFCISILR